MCNCLDYYSIYLLFTVPIAVPDKDMSSDPHLLLNLLLGRGLVSRQSLGGLVDLAEQGTAVL